MKSTHNCGSSSVSYSLLTPRLESRLILYTPCPQIYHFFKKSLLGDWYIKSKIWALGTLIVTGWLLQSVLSKNKARIDMFPHEAFPSFPFSVPLPLIWKTLSLYCWMYVIAPQHRAHSHYPTGLIWNSF